ETEVGICRPTLDELDPGIAGGKDFELLGPRLGLGEISGAKRKLGQDFDQARIATIELIGTRESIVRIVIAAHRRLHLAKLGAIDSCNRIAGRTAASRPICVRRGRLVIGRLLARVILAWAVVGFSVAAAAAQAPLSVPPAATVSGTPYRINPGDQLQILVWGD